ARGVETLPMARIVRVGDALAIDHVIAARRRPFPGVVVAARTPSRRIQQRLGGDTAPERTRAAEQVAVRNRHARASCAGLVSSRLTGGTGSDDHEIAAIPGAPQRRIQGVVPTGAERTG